MFRTETFSLSNSFLYAVSDSSCHEAKYSIWTNSFLWSRQPNPRFRGEIFQTTICAALWFLTLQYLRRARRMTGSNPTLQFYDQSSDSPIGPVLVGNPTISCPGQANQDLFRQSIVSFVFSSFFVLNTKL